jgi:hypothetical protein
MKTLELTKRALNITIAQDNNDENPLNWNDSVKVAYSSPIFILGNEKVSNLEEHIMDLLEYGEEYRNRMYDKHGDTKDLFDVLLERLNKKGYVALPVYAYIHSGVTVATTPFGCRWDSGLSGFIYTKRTDYIKEFGVKKNVKNSVIEDYLKSDLKTFDTWLRGEVYGFSIEDAETGEILDSCRGFYGSDYANSMVEYIDYQEYGYTKEEMIQLIEDTEVTF